ncbi:MBL fold metallo-hydrolase [Neobacillus drentensis]|uniref:MBL fold metallo-hydrolase n=1 Tax=Neobacillus drentensis TaxID=220684 RepID=UPI003001AA91
MENSIKEMGSILMDFLKGNPNGRPKNPILMEKLNLSDQQNDSQPKITWFGHSALLLELEEKRILLDPMFGGAPTPFPIFGIKRYSKGLPFIIEDLPTIDIVIISHDHYDHLDYGTIRKIKEKVKQFIVPLGVGSHLEKWGVHPAIIKELDWWDELDHEGLKFAATPARHFSGRSLTDRDATLWCSWVIESENTKIFFSGDSGYGPHFKEIGEKYGPFNLTLMECGQYDHRWAAIHMTPEETVQAHLDVKGEMMIPIHWGAFTLALHDWTDPIERVTNAAEKQNIDISTPKIGETIFISSEEYPRNMWWR